VTMGLKTTLGVILHANKLFKALTAAQFIRTGLHIVSLFVEMD